MHFGRRVRELEQMRATLEAQAETATHGAALRQLRQIWQQMLKGEVGLRVEVWRMAMRMHKVEQHQQMVCALEAQMLAQSQGSGLRGPGT